MNEALRVALEQVDADSWEEMVRGVPADVAATLKIAIDRDGPVVTTYCLANDSPLVNRTIALGLAAPCTRAQIVALVEDFVSKGLKNFALQISPHAQPAELPQWLSDAGLVIRSKWMKLVRGNAPFVSPPSKFEVRSVSAADKTLFGDTSARGFGRPPIIAHWMASTVNFPRWRHYLAYAEGEPAGAAAIFINGEYAWLGVGSTLPEYRQQGVQQALIAQRIVDGLALGVKYFVSETESVNTSCKNLMRAGFELAYERPNYGIPASEQ